MELEFWIAVVILPFVLLPFVLWLVWLARPSLDSGLPENATRLTDHKSSAENLDEVAPEGGPSFDPANYDKVKPGFIAVANKFPELFNELEDTVASFLRVFAIMTSRDHKRIIQFYRSKHGCGFVGAMKLAIIDRQNDEERFR